MKKKKYIAPLAEVAEYEEQLLVVGSTRATLSTANTIETSEEVGSRTIDNSFWNE